MAEACLHPYADRLYCMAEREYESMSDKRLGVIGIVIGRPRFSGRGQPDFKPAAGYDCGPDGYPYREKEVNVIAFDSGRHHRPIGLADRAAGDCTPGTVKALSPRGAEPGLLKTA